MIKIYNTLTRKKEVFQPIETGKVRMYVCGPTVYNYIHIGNGRSAVAFDTIRRYLEYRGYEVNYVSNFTDVDDKIIQKAKELDLTPKEVAERFIQAFKEDVSQLNVQPATLNPQAVDHIEAIIDFIQVLLDKGYAYASDGDVYYRTRAFEGYGKLSHQAVDDLEVGASKRIGDEQDKKEDPLDFALWKAAKKQEVSWDSPWGKGRPGWHIECSVMATKHLGETIDIHGGGQDLEFPHHENEIAQSEAKTGQPFARYWMHNGFVTVGDEGEKMSKSLGNFVTVHELVRQMEPQILRFFLATTQYRRPIKFSESLLKEAETNLQRLRTAYNNLKFREKDAYPQLDDDLANFDRFSDFEDRFIEGMDDDFNVANGITVVYDFAKWMNQYAEQEHVSIPVLEQFFFLFESWLKVFGIELNEPTLLDAQIDQLLAERVQARVEKNFKRSDEIRDLLKEQGIILEDTAQGTRWRREK